LVIIAKIFPGHDSEIMSLIAQHASAGKDSRSE
jgi:hypothetical protein